MTRALQSLIGQLVIALVAIALVAVIGLSALMNWQLERVVRDVHAESLLILSEGIARTVSFDAAGNVVLALPSDIAQRFARGTGRFRYLLLDAEGRTIMASHDQMKSMLHPGPIAEVEAFEYQDGTTELWGVALPLRSGDRLLQLQLAEDMSSAESILDQIPGRAFWPMGFGVLAVLVGASLVMLLAARHVLRPVRLASMQAEQIGPGSHIRGITVPRLPTEVEPLIRAVNGALDRLDGAYRRQREFSADVAHELRTPLTIMRTQADLLPDRALAQTLRRDIDGMIRLVNQLLDSADAERLEIGVDARVDLAEIGRDVAAMLAPAAIRDRKSVEFVDDGGPIVVRGDADALAGALRNLVENAISHTGAETSVTIRMERPGSVSVIDAGPGVPENQRDAIFERFWRSDRRRGGRTGLGLAIVRRIVAAHGGRISIHDGPSGGAIFKIELQPAPEHDSRHPRRRLVGPSLRG